VVHAEIPAQAAITAGIGRIRTSLEESPALAVRAGSVAVIYRSLAGRGLVARRVEPGFDGEGLGVRGVKRRVERNFGAGREVKKFGAVTIPCDRPRERVHDSGRTGPALEEHGVI